MSKEITKLQNKSVGLIVFLSGTGDALAVLLRRGRHEQAGDQYRQETYPGICQATMHVKMTPEEANSGAMGLERALERGIKKELGLPIYNELKKLGQLEKLNPLSNLQTDNKTVLTFGVLLSTEVFNKFSRTPPGTRKVVVSPQTLPRIETINPMDKDMTIDEKTIVMFPDELEALKKGFKELFKK